MLHINVCNIPREHTMSVLSGWLSCPLPDKYNGNGALSQHGVVIWTLGRGENAREGTVYVRKLLKLGSSLNYAWIFEDRHYCARSPLHDNFPHTLFTRFHRSTSFDPRIDGNGCFSSLHNCVTSIRWKIISCVITVGRTGKYRVQI